MVNRFADVYYVVLEHRPHFSRHIGSSRLQQKQRRTNCIEFVQRVLHRIGKRCCKLVSVPFGGLIIYTPFTLWRSRKALPQLKHLRGATQFIGLPRMTSILRSDDLRLIIFSVVHHTLSAIGARHIGMVWTSNWVYQFYF